MPYFGLLHLISQFIAMACGYFKWPIRFKESFYLEYSYKRVKLTCKNHRLTPISTFSEIFFFFFLKHMPAIPPPPECTWSRNMQEYVVSLVKFLLAFPLHTHPKKLCLYNVKKKKLLSRLRTPGSILCVNAELVFTDHVWQGGGTWHSGVHSF